MLKSRVVGCALLLCLAACGGGSGQDEEEVDDKPIGSWLATADARAYVSVATTDGSAFLGGTFLDSAAFDAGKPSAQNLATAGGYDGFVAKYDPDGTLVWVQQIGGTGSDQVRALAVLPDGGVVAVGLIGSSAVYAAGQPEAVTMAGPGILLARYAPDGRLLWATQSVGGLALTVVAHANRTISVLGYTGHNESTVLGPGETTETTIAGNSRTLFLARYDAETGALLRARQEGRAGNMLGVQAVGTSDSGVVVAGTFQHTAVFDEGDPGEASIAAGASFGAYIARYDSNDAFLWVRSPTATGARVQFGGVDVLSDGALAVCGTMVDATAVFGAGEPNETTLATAEEVFTAAVLESNGDLRWARQTVAATGGEARNARITRLPDGRLATTGTVREGQTFGAGESTARTITPVGKSAAVLSVFGQAFGAHVETLAVTGPDSEWNESVAVFPDGAVLWVGQYDEFATFPLFPEPRNDEGAFVARFVLDDLLGE